MGVFPMHILEFVTKEAKEKLGKATNALVHQTKVDIGKWVDQAGEGGAGALHRWAKDWLAFA